MNISIYAKEKAHSISNMYLIVNFPIWLNWSVLLDFSQTLFFFLTFQTLLNQSFSYQLLTFLF